MSISAASEVFSKTYVKNLQCNNLLLQSYILSRTKNSIIIETAFIVDR